MADPYIIKMPKLTDTMEAVGKADKVILVGLGVVVIVRATVFLTRRKKKIAAEDAEVIREESESELTPVEAEEAVEKAVE